MYEYSFPFQEHKQSYHLYFGGFCPNENTNCRVMAMKRYNVPWAQLFWNSKNTYHNSHIFINIALPMVADRFMFIYMLEKSVYA